MFLKTIVTFIVSHLFFFGAHTTSKPLPPLPATSKNPISSISTSTPQVADQKNATTTKSVLIASKQTPPPSSKPKTVPAATPKAAANTTQANTATTPTTPTPSPEPTPDFEMININARKAIVNIFCVTANSSLSSISGTGVIVSSDGLILTNAHVAQYLLLKDYTQPGFVSCTARTGSPAYPTYNLELVYISPTWVEKNKSILREQNPLGTGENDYAFLRITGRIDGSPQDSYSFVPMDIRESISVGEPVLLASYPAGFLGGMSIIRDLNLTSAIDNIATLYTFGSTTIDVISVPGTVVSQKGSSGGAVVDKRTHLIGLISTSSDGKTTSERDLQAITSAYINRDMQKTLGVTLAQFIYSNHTDFANTFASTTAPRLSKLIEDELSK